MSSNILTAGQCAAYLGLHVKTVRRMVRERRLPYGRVGGRLRFFPAELDDFVKRGLSRLPAGQRSILP